MLALRLALVIVLFGARAISDLVPELPGMAFETVRKASERCIPAHLRRRFDGPNETATMARLRNLWAAQEEFRRIVAVDEDRDGIGECGGLAEMMGLLDRRGEGLVKTTWSVKRFEGGRAIARGYSYRLYLPRKGGGLVAEDPEGGFPKGTVDPDLAEMTWCVYAWPIDAGLRTFFLSAGGSMLATEGYFGPHEPAPHAADGPDGRVAAGATGRDGRFWRETG